MKGLIIAIIVAFVFTPLLAFSDEDAVDYKCEDIFWHVVDSYKDGSTIGGTILITNKDLPTRNDNEMIVHNRKFTPKGSNSLFKMYANFLKDNPAYFHDYKFMNEFRTVMFYDFKNAQGDKFDGQSLLAKMHEIFPDMAENPYVYNDNATYGPGSVIYIEVSDSWKTVGQFQSKNWFMDWDWSPARPYVFSGAYLGLNCVYQQMPNSQQYAYYCDRYNYSSATPPGDYDQWSAMDPATYDKYVNPANNQFDPSRYAAAMKAMSGNDPSKISAKRSIVAHNNDIQNGCNTSPFNIAGVSPPDDLNNFILDEDGNYYFVDPEVGDAIRDMGVPQIVDNDHIFVESQNGTDGGYHKVQEVPDGPAIPNGAIIKNRNGTMTTYEYDGVTYISNDEGVAKQADKASQVNGTDYSPSLPGDPETTGGEATDWTALQGQIDGMNNFIPDLRETDLLRDMNPEFDMPNATSMGTWYSDFKSLVPFSDVLNDVNVDVGGSSTIYLPITFQGQDLSRTVDFAEYAEYFLIFGNILYFFCGLKAIRMMVSGK